MLRTRYEKPGTDLLRIILYQLDDPEGVFGSVGGHGEGWRYAAREIKDISLCASTVCTAREIFTFDLAGLRCRPMALPNNFVWAM